MAFRPAPLHILEGLAVGLSLGHTQDGAVGGAVKAWIRYKGYLVKRVLWASSGG